MRQDFQFKKTALWNNLAYVIWIFLISFWGFFVFLTYCLFLCISLLFPSLFLSLYSYASEAILLTYFNTAVNDLPLLSLHGLLYFVALDPYIWWKLAWMEMQWCRILFCCINELQDKVVKMIEMIAEVKASRLSPHKFCQVGVCRPPSCFIVILGTS